MEEMKGEFDPKLECSGPSPMCALKSEIQQNRKWTEVQSFRFTPLGLLQFSLYLWHESLAWAFITNHFPHLDFWSPYLWFATSYVSFFFCISNWKVIYFLLPISVFPCMNIFFECLLCAWHHATVLSIVLLKISKNILPACTELGLAMAS